MIVTCRRGHQFSGISLAQLEEVLDEEEGWTCPRCGDKHDPFEDPKEASEPTFDIGPIVNPKKARA